MAGNCGDELKFAPVLEIDVWTIVEQFQGIRNNSVCLLGVTISIV